MKLLLVRLYFRLTGRCIRYMPDERGLCRSCRIPGAGMEVGS
jgi:hypothetical protein